ncbi:MAG: shikimate kinase [Desulfobulbaceae bacterium]|nr:MAG: shikimate kinase [Desulfobulbaceae bacterium]
MQTQKVYDQNWPQEKYFLIGYRASGKTVVGRLLALQLGAEFLDMDAEISHRTKMSIQEMVARHGWDYFRAKERKLLQELGREPEPEPLGPPGPPGPALVVATGGGAVLQRDLWPRIRARHLVIWLKANPATIAARIKADAISDEQRPALTEQDLLVEISTVLAQREELYRQASHLQIDTTTTDQAVIVEQIIAERAKRAKGPNGPRA